MSKLASLVVVKKAKKEAIQPVDPVNVYQVRHLRQQKRCHQPKKQDLNVPRQVVKKLVINIDEKRRKNKCKLAVLTVIWFYIDKINAKGFLFW